jgi:hypothetical protein
MADDDGVWSDEHAGRSADRLDVHHSSIEIFLGDTGKASVEVSAGISLDQTISLQLDAQNGCCLAEQLIKDRIALFVDYRCPR